MAGKILCLIMGIFVTKEGNSVEIYEGHKPFIVSNHTSFVDIIITTSSIDCAYICKKGISRIPIIGMVSKAIGCLYVERTSAESRKKAGEELCKRARDNSLPRLCVFPEGTTSSGSQLLKFKYGAFKPGMPVQPAVIKYITPFGKISWDIQNGFICVLSILSSPFIIAKIKFLPVYVPNDQEKENPEIYADNLKVLMAEELGLPTDYPFKLEDKFTYRSYYRGQLTYDKMKQLLEISYGPEIFKWDGTKHLKKD